MSTKLKILLLITVASLIVFWCNTLNRRLAFKANCRDYLVLAANSSSATLAAEHLKKAVDYIDNRKLTSGYTSFIFNTPNDDVGLWSQNLKTALRNIETAKELETNQSLSLTARERQISTTNALINLRGAILRKGENESEAIYPDSIMFFPYQSQYMIWGIGSGLALAFILYAHLSGPSKPGD